MDKTSAQILFWMGHTEVSTAHRVCVNVVRTFYAAQQPSGSFEALDQVFALHGVYDAHDSQDEQYGLAMNCCGKQFFPGAKAASGSPLEFGRQPRALIDRPLRIEFHGEVGAADQ